MKKVLIGLSGGVDSAASALLLKQKGYEVIGSTMKLLDTDTSSVVDLCNELNIPFYEIDYREEFKKEIIDYFGNSYNNCETPNPCIMCNKSFKFGKFYDYAKKNKIDYIATGHYAKIEYSNKYNRYVLRKADNLDKDQSYFLYYIKKEILPYVIFPLSNYESKEDIRKLVKNNNISNHSKKDSQDVCFIEDNNYKKFLVNNNYINPSKGDIVYNNKVIGKHDGLYNYTIGQRKGIGISNKEPLYVIGFSKDKNILYVGLEKDLYIKEFYVKDYNLLLVDEILEPLEVDVKVRYRSSSAKAYIIEENNLIKVTFIQEQKGVTKGQSAVFYIDDIVLGGGIIK